VPTLSSLRQEYDSLKYSSRVLALASLLSLEDEGVLGSTSRALIYEFLVEHSEEDAVLSALRSLA
jgi:hypothetical protein